jgi:2-phosphosulfolactate phosphatase
VIDVAFTPAGLRPAGVAVVIDVLRATSTATQALASGYRSVTCADSLARARSLRGPGRVLAGERECVMPLGFDLGNSPIGVAHSETSAELVLATTNGAPAVVAAAAAAGTVLLACLLNLDAVARAIDGEGDVLIVCAGVSGRVALEDVYVAGRLLGSVCASPGRTDAALLAMSVARSFPSPFDAFVASAGGRALIAAGMRDDVSYCALESTLDVVPSVELASHGVASVACLDKVSA